MNDPIDSQMATITVPSTISGALVLRLTTDGIVTLVIPSRSVSYEVYGIGDDLVRKIVPHMVRKTITKGKRMGQPYLIGRGTVTVDPADAGREATPDEYGVVNIAVTDIHARPMARPAAEDIRALFA